MKNIIILFVIPLLLSCQTNNFDLEHLSFPINLSTIEKEHKVSKNSDLSGIIVYSSTDKNLLQFSGFSFAGTLNEQDNSILSTNYVSFYENRTTSKVNAYRLEIRTTPKAEGFEKMLEKKFGETDFYYRDKEFSYRVWNVGTKLYLFETNNTGRYNNEKFRSCSLYVIASDDKLLSEYFITGGFQYYGDYLREKSKPEHKGQKYFYRNFIDEKQKQDGNDSFYLKDYVK
jgi:hypothetical protein